MYKLINLDESLAKGATKQNKINYNLEWKWIEKFKYTQIKRSLFWIS